MEAQLRILLDRQAILDCMHRYCLGVDRHDVELITSAFHPDAIAEHGPFRGDPHALARWANDFHSRHCNAHTHNITTHGCEIDGDVAHAQTHCLYGLLQRDTDLVLMGSARYVDRLERRDGQWRIALRKTLIEWRGELRASMPSGYLQGRQDRADPAYDRPLRRTASETNKP